MPVLALQMLAVLAHCLDKQSAVRLPWGRKIKAATVKEKAQTSH